MPYGAANRLRYNFRYDVSKADPPGPRQGQPEGAGPAAVDPEEGADHLNAVGLPDANGHAWTPATLAAYLSEHDIRTEAVPDMRDFKFAVPDREWNGRSILRTIERGPEDAEAALRQAIADDPEVRRDVIRFCETVNDCPYRPGLYREWWNFARQHDA